MEPHCEYNFLVILKSDVFASALSRVNTFISNILNIIKYKHFLESVACTVQKNARISVLFPTSHRIFYCVSCYFLAESGIHFSITALFSFIHFFTALFISLDSLTATIKDDMCLSSSFIFERNSASSGFSSFNPFLP